MKIYLSTIFLVIITIPSFSQTYKETKIGSQTWMVQNLNVDKFQNGDAIPHAKTKEDWKNAYFQKQPAWCYYDNNPSNEAKYGKLYNWYAVNDPRGLAPEGWHVATEDEWVTLEKNLGDEAAKKMKMTSNWDGYSTGGYSIACSNCESWSAEYRKKVPCHDCKDTRKSGKSTPIVEHSGNGTNSSGFSGLPGGYCDNHGNYINIGKEGKWWSSSKINSSMASSIILVYDISRAGKKVVTSSSKPFGLSVRCLKGNTELKKEVEEVRPRSRTR